MASALLRSTAPMKPRRRVRPRIRAPTGAATTHSRGGKRAATALACGESWRSSHGWVVVVIVVVVEGGGG